ncbi:MAG TPA: hypothetical protein VGP02_07415 [Mycobacteriales bacterium]|nr:hypothetical protein [Mycobacteriales bacterium]
MTCVVCGAPGVDRVPFRPDLLQRLIGGRVEPPRPHAGPYAGTGVRVRREEPPVFCARHVRAARELAAARLTLRTALRRLRKSGGPPT